MGKFGTLIFVAACFLVGCAVPPAQHYGNFVANSAPVSLSVRMADDTVKQLLALYPPASTRFDFKQSATDTYGVALVESLRANGYALLEFKPEDAVYDLEPEAPAMEAEGISFNYIIDAASTNLYRLLVIVGPRTLSRAYLVQNSTIAPAGAWARKE